MEAAAADCQLLIAAYYNGQSGRPYTFLFLSDVNADSKTGNDLVFIPSSEGQVIFTNGTFAQLDAYIKGDPQLGEVARARSIPRNARAGRGRTGSTCRRPAASRWDRGRSSSARTS